MENATLIFRDGRFPDDFWRPSAPTGTLGLREVFSAHPIGPGRNVAGVDTYVEDPDAPVKTIFDTCGMYKHLVESAAELYPEPEGVLKRNLLINLQYLYAAVAPIGCEEVTPYGGA